MTAQNVAPGSVEIASGYTVNTSPGPEMKKWRGGNLLFILPQFGLRSFYMFIPFFLASEKAYDPWYPAQVCLKGQFLSDLLLHLD